jgi:hypothetical protein
MRLKTFLPLALLLTPAIVLAQESSDSVVQWNHIVGVITAPGVNNVVAGISSGAGPWSVQEGHARVDLASGQVSFEVRGLVLNGSNSSGTPGTINTVTGTLVCNSGTGSLSREMLISVERSAEFPPLVPIRCSWCASDPASQFQVLSVDGSQRAPFALVATATDPLQSNRAGRRRVAPYEHLPRDRALTAPE